MIVPAYNEEARLGKMLSEHIAVNIINILKISKRIGI